MRPKSSSYIYTFVLFFLYSISSAFGQNFGAKSSAVWLSNCSQSDYFNTSGSGADLIGPGGNSFNNTNLGVYTQNSGNLVLRGAQVRTFKNSGANVCSARMHYRIYAQSATPGSFSVIDLPLTDDCNGATGQFPSGGSCQAGDQKWYRVIEDGETNPAPVNLTAFAPGNYTLEVYYDVTGSSSSTTLCNETEVLNNGGTNYKATFSIQSPVLLSTNPTSCNGTEGAITISGLVPGVTYEVNYSDDGVAVGPLTLVADGSGKIVISGLNAGVYADFLISANGCSTEFNTGLILSNPLITPKFNKIAPFCAGSVAPTLPTMSLNGISGGWSPSVINNQVSGSYTFTPTPGQCGMPVTMNVTVTPNKVPAFSFGTAFSICAGASVPTLPTTSQNGVSGTWNPSVINNGASATYTFTPTAGQCATATTLSVTVNPNVTPAFDLGSSLTLCAGGSVPTLPTTSNNGITGSWSPSTIDNQNSATYTFTPSAGQCATTISFSVTVNPNVTPAFSFGSTLSICSGSSVPALPATSTNGITGTWNPATVDNKASGVYTFTPSAGQCATQTTFSVIVNPVVVPTFGFGSTLTVCQGETVPALPTTSDNGITGTWNPATIDNQNSGTYTFTPDAGQCATTTTFTVSVNPNVAPSFSFGASLTICAGGNVPTLPATSTNGITGTWNPSAVDNQNSGTYTFTPAAGQCATVTSFSVTVNPNINPTFSFGNSLIICAGESVPTLPNTSDNGITGTWNPATINNQASGNYTFTPDAGQCATSTTFTVTVTQKIVPNFSFGTTLNICAGGSVPTLPTTSNNGITGTWSPSSVDDQASGVYTFTPDAGQCATTTNFTVTVNPIVAPVFNFGPSLTLCAGATSPSLPSVSNNGITGVWTPAAIDNQASGTYTFTPSAGQCASSVTLSVTINPNTTPVFDFGSSLTICAGGSVPSLPTTSVNGVTGTWNPSIVDNQNSGTYTFTPTAGQCATTTTFSVTVNPNVIPLFDFGTALIICDGGNVPTLPNTSLNGITGVWSPSVVDNNNSATYTFTPAQGLCATTTTFTVTVNPIVTPTFELGSSITICAGSVAPTLPTMSLNGISGGWSPSVINNQVSGSYTFTPTPGQCGMPVTISVTVTPNKVPAFSFGTAFSICAGASVPTLPTTSQNGVSGTWNPSVINNGASATYTFTPTAGQCATATTLSVTVNPNVTPAFDLGSSLTLCAGGSVPTLPTTSNNGITGSWSPSTIDNQNSATYTFTPSAGQCATTISFSVTVNPNVTPAFSFGSTLSICSGSSVPALPATSTNGITGTWNPATVDNKASGVYTFTPSAGQCATQTTFTVTVNPVVVPTFGFGSTLTICQGETVPALPTTSDNGITGTWNPTTIDNQTSATYTFTPDVLPGQCFDVAKLEVTVNPLKAPTFGFASALTVCKGTTPPALPKISSNGIVGNWDVASIDNQNSGIYIFRPAAGACSKDSFILTVTVPPVATVNSRTDITVNDGVTIPENTFTGTPTGVSFSWTNSNPSIGLASSGTGNVPSFTAINRGNSPVSANITVTPKISGCAGASSSYIINVIPLDKDVFVPNVFSPNGDGKNDILYVYGNYIDKLDMRIFNQWGQQIELITDKTRGWDGKYKGKAQPVGVYVYTLNAVLADGRNVKLKGSITLIR